LSPPPTPDFTRTSWGISADNRTNRRSRARRSPGSLPQVRPLPGKRGSAGLVYRATMAARWPPCSRRVSCSLRFFSGPRPRISTLIVLARLGAAAWVRSDNGHVYALRSPLSTRAARTDDSARGPPSRARRCSRPDRLVAPSGRPIGLRLRSRSPARSTGADRVPERPKLPPRRGDLT